MHEVDERDEIGDTTPVELPLQILRCFEALALICLQPIRVFLRVPRSRERLDRPDVLQLLDDCRLVLGEL